MIGLLRRASTIQISLLLALSALVTGLGRIVQGATTSAFLPEAFAAVLLGWGLGRTRLKAWPVLAGLWLLGCIFIWGGAAQWGLPFLQLAASAVVMLGQNFLYLHGGSIPTADALAAFTAALQNMLAQSAAVWARVDAWQGGLRAGQQINDPVVRVLVWSLLLWPVAVWPGWAGARRKPLVGLLPGLALLAGITQYTSSEVISLWLMVTCLLGLMCISAFDSNRRRWILGRVDYADLTVVYSLIAASILTVALALLGLILPTISVKDIFESFRRRTGAENQAAQSLGLQPGKESVNPVQSPFTPARDPGLPNKHLVGATPEMLRQVVFTVSTGELPPQPDSQRPLAVPRHYWRSYTFDIYTGVGWFSSQVHSIPNPAGQALYPLPPGYTLLKQSFNLKNGAQGSLYWSGVLYQSNLPFEAGWRIPPGQAYPAAVDPFRGADLYGAVNSTASYEIESLVVQASEAQLRAAGRDTPDFIQQRYTSLPAEVPERVYALARSLTSAAATQYDEALAIESYLRANYPYTLDVPEPPGGQDVADYFLFDLKKGYCDYYATAMVVLARSVGLPARMVMGYASGSYNTLTAEYVVTGADAHAWVEIYFPGLGWVEFEPTAGRPAFVRALPGADASRVEPVPARPLDKLVRTVYGLPTYLRWGLFVMAVVIGLVGLFFLLEGWLLGLLPPSAAMRWMYRSLYRQARRLSGSAPPGQTASEFTQALQAAFAQPDAHLELLTGLYLKNLFSSHPIQKAELRLAVRAWLSLRWKLLWARSKKPPK